MRRSSARAGSLYSAALSRTGSSRGGSSSRGDLRRTPVPNLPIEAQRSYGAAYRRLAELSQALRELVDAGDTAVDLGIESLSSSALRPDG